MPCLALHCTLSFLPSIRIDPMLQASIRVVTSNSTTTNSTQDPVWQQHIAHLPPAVPYRAVQLKPPRTAPLHRAQGLDFHSICSVTCKDALSHIPRIPFMCAGFIVPSLLVTPMICAPHRPSSSYPLPMPYNTKQANLAFPGTKENKGWRYCRLCL